MAYGHIESVHTVHCGGCDANCKSACNSLAAAIELFREQGWVTTAKRGWQCPVCVAVDDVMEKFGVR